jgi:WD40-like Beta Propeller Repeat
MDRRARGRFHEEHAVKPRLVTVLAIALAATAPAAQAAYPGGNGRIAFHGSGGVIASVKADGSDYQVHATGTEPAWSPSGEKLAFTSPVPSAITVVNADGSGRRNHTSRGTGSGATWSPDGDRLALAWRGFEGSTCGGIAITRLDGTESRVIAQTCPADLEWSPTGDRLAYSAGSPAEIFTIKADGTDLTQVTNETDAATDPDWSPDGSRIAYDVAQAPDSFSQQVFTIRPDGTDRTPLGEGRSPAWSPDGGEIAVLVRSPVNGVFRIEVVRTNHASRRTIMHGGGGGLDWQPVDPGFTGYPRPKSARPVEASLVPTYSRCQQPNREHGPPLAHPSCSPPVPRSNYLTVGSPDANGLASRFTGNVAYRVVAGNPSTPEDEADVPLTATLTDVFCRVAGPACTAGALSDFAGLLRLHLVVRITDKHNELGHAITLPSAVMVAEIPCSVTPASTAGSDCGTSTTLDALVPGIVPERKHSIWEFEQITVFDGGPNGDLSGSPTPFAVPGIWVP